MASATSNTLSAVSNLAQSNATAVASIETLASTTLASLHTYESALSEATSGVTVELDLVSGMASANSAAISNLDNDATSVLASVAFVSLTSLHIGYTRITMADGTSFSCVGFVTST
jgi:hypothetical protein